MDGFLGTKETLTRKRVEEIFREKQYSFFEQKVTLAVTFRSWMMASWWA
ncbi:MAG: hypothetical protein WD688_26985 [Candidatus Binatia bacterium]